MKFHVGDKVKILRGQHAGQIMTVSSCTTDEVWLEELGRSQSMSVGNVEKVNEEFL